MIDYYIYFQWCKITKILWMISSTLNCFNSFYFKPSLLTSLQYFTRSTKIKILKMKYLKIRTNGMKYLPHLFRAEIGHLNRWLILSVTRTLQKITQTCCLSVYIHLKCFSMSIWTWWGISRINFILKNIMLSFTLSFFPTTSVTVSNCMLLKYIDNTVNKIMFKINPTT